MLRYRRLTYSLAAAALLCAALAIAQSSPLALGLATVDDPVLGTILVDQNGSTLYVRLGETETSASCTGTCLRDWSPAPAPASGLSAQALQAAGLSHLATDLASFTRSDGAAQLSYQGQPLYTAVGDVPGESRANGLDGVWYAANVTPLVRVVAHPVHGEILVGPNGRTLYVYADDRDEDVGYQCDEACSENFPPLVVSHRSFLPLGAPQPTALASLDRAADSWRVDRVQVMFEGQPLYYWSRDTKPGDVNGDGIAGLWRVARPGLNAGR